MSVVQDWQAGRLTGRAAVCSLLQKVKLVLTGRISDISSLSLPAHTAPLPCQTYFSQCGASYGEFLQSQSLGREQGKLK